MIIRSLTLCHCVAWEGAHGEGIGNPICENDLSWNRFLSVVSVELNMKMISLNECIYRYSFIYFIDISFCCYHERNLTWLEVEVHWSIGCNHSLCWITIIIGTILGLNISVEITFRDTINVDVRLWEVWDNFNDKFTISQDICLWQVVSQT